MKNAEDILKEKNREMVSVSPDTLVLDAVRLMTEHRIGAILVKEGERIAGIWTERDLLYNTAKEEFDPKAARIGDTMTKNLISAKHDDTVYKLLDKFIGLRKRHLLIEKEGMTIGLISSGDTIRASLAEKDRELKELNAYISWEYYDNWRWKYD